MFEPGPRTPKVLHHQVQLSANPKGGDAVQVPDVDPLELLPRVAFVSVIGYRNRCMPTTGLGIEGDDAAKLAFPLSVGDKVEVAHAREHAALHTRHRDGASRLVAQNDIVGGVG